MEINKLINNFYYSDIVLSRESVEELREKKQLNIQRLKEGLDEYNAEKGKDYKVAESAEQGSIAMSTAIKSDYSDFDLDMAIIFEKDNIPNEVDKVKKIVEDALKRKCENFKEPPKIKTNCITVNYQGDYHIDFAIYRKQGDCYEHCGSEWTERQPRDITKWFIQENRNMGGILRKITKIIKYFCRCRSGWNMPGGLIITVLCHEALCINQETSLAIKDTVNNIIQRLENNEDVLNPVNNQSLIQQKNKYLIQLRNFKEKLKEYIKDINGLNLNSDDESIRKAWNKFFNTNFSDDEARSLNSNNGFYEDDEEFIDNMYSSDMRLPINITVKCQKIVQQSQNSFGLTHINCNENETFKLSQTIYKKLKFSVDISSPISLPYNVLWKVKNNGVNAIKGNSLRGHIYFGNDEGLVDNINSKERYEPIAFAGNHYVECYIIKNNRCIAKKKYSVKIED